jgi:hypothetical protein
MRFFKYAKSAFLYHWNLLAFGAGVGFAFLSGRPDIGLPLVAAAELGYLSLLSTHPRYRKYVEAQEAKAQRESQAAGAGKALNRILAALPPKSLQRFDALRDRCLELRHIASGLKDPGESPTDAPLEQLQMSGLDRLLWTFLRLLYTQHMLDRFVQSTNEPQIRKTMANLEQSLRSQSFPPEDHQKQKIRKALEDNLETSRQRLANLEKARDNGELVRHELDRLENKIQSLSEVAVNRHEPDFIAGQVDQVASSMAQTERTMQELNFATGLAEEDEEVPRLMQREAVQARK